MDLAQSLFDPNPPRARSVIVTLFGDAIVPCGGEVWLGTLVKLAAPLGLSERLVRTAVNRLTQEQWLESRRSGRRSFYRLTHSGALSFDNADRRIYSLAPRRWDGRWRIALLLAGDTDPPSRLRHPQSDSASVRDDVRRELRWHGFVAINPGVLVHPTADTGRVMQALAKHELIDHVALFDSARQVGANPARLKRQFLTACGVSELSDAYLAYRNRLRALLDHLGPMQTLSPTMAFSLRIALVHEFRRLTLRDPQLPDALLPADWPGRDARDLTASLYHQVDDAAEAHLHEVALNDDAPLPECAREITRFTPRREPDRA
jgi:phenylacetic acid degradation operon negative regulatory protein